MLISRREAEKRKAATETWANDFSWEKVLQGQDNGQDMVYLELDCGSHSAEITPGFLAWRKDGVTVTGRREPQRELWKLDCHYHIYSFRLEKEGCPGIACLVRQYELTLMADMVQLPEDFGPIYLRVSGFYPRGMLVCSPFGVYFREEPGVICLAPGSAEHRAGGSLDIELFNCLDQKQIIPWDSLLTPSWEQFNSSGAVNMRTEEMDKRLRYRKLMLCAEWLNQRYRISGQWDGAQEEWLDFLSEKAEPKLYRFAVQELMDEAARRLDRPFFEEMLARAEELQRRTGEPFGVVHRPDWYFPPEEGRVRHYEILETSSFWIPPEHPWFTETVERLGEGLQCLPYQRPFHKHNLLAMNYFTNLPAHYVALIGGYMEPVKWFYKQGAYGQGWLEKLPRREPRLTNPERPVPRAASNVLTAALYSGRYQMVRFIFKRFPLVQCRREMLYPLSRCDARLLRWVLHQRPELWDIIALRDVLRFQSTALLEAWLHQHPEGLPAGYSLPCRPRYDQRPSPRSEEQSKFFYLLAKHTADPDTRLSVLRQWVGWLGTDIRWVTSSFTEKEQVWFNELMPQGTDLTPLITGQENKRRIFQGLLWCSKEVSENTHELIPHSFDLYSITPHMIRRTASQLLKEIRPVRILPQSDPVTTELAKYFTLAELMEMGFVTPVNLPHIRLSRRSPSFTDTESLALIQQMVRDHSMRERYSFEE